MASASDVPGKYDVVINGGGYVFAEGEDPRAQYGYTPTFLERQNVGTEYGDDQQDFFLTVAQSDWSLGEERRFADPTDEDLRRRYWTGTSVDPVTVAGQVSLRNTMASVSFGQAVIAAVAHPANGTVFAAGATRLYEVASDGTVTDRGLHGQGGTRTRYSLTTDGSYVYIGGVSTGGTTGTLRGWNGSAFSDIGTSNSSYLGVAMIGNTPYYYSDATGAFYNSATLGAATLVYQWKDAQGTALTGANYRAKLISGGGSIIILRAGGSGRAAELWKYDGASTFQIAEFPPNFVAGDATIIGGVTYVGGYVSRNSSKYPAIYYYTNGSIGELWASKTSGYTSSTWAALCSWQGGIAFTDDTQGKLMWYDLATGSVHSMASYTVTNAESLLCSTKDFMLHIRNSTTGWYFPTSTVASSGTVTSGLYDFGNTLTKQFRGIKIDADIPTGATVDIAYRIGDVDGSYTTLQSSAVSGTEYTLSGISGNTISVKITLNKGSSSAGPVLKRIYVRAAPQLSQYRQFTYIIDCSGRDGKSNTKLRNGAPQPLDGQTQASNLATAIASTSPISVTDRFGTMTTVFLEPEKCQFREVRPEEYVAVIAGRQV